MLFIRGPFNLKAAYDRDVARIGMPPTTPLAEANLAGLPLPVRRYLRATSSYASIDLTIDDVRYGR